MRKVWAARNQRGEIIFVGAVTEDACETLRSTIGDFKSLGELKQHPQVYSLEVAKPVNESVSIAEKEIEGGVVLSRSEYIIFSTLSEKFGELVPRNLLMTALQNFGTVKPEKLTLLVSRLRRKIKAIGYSIYSEYGEGYVLRKKKKKASATRLS